MRPEEYKKPYGNKAEALQQAQLAYKKAFQILNCRDENGFYVLWRRDDYKEAFDSAFLDVDEAITELLKVEGQLELSMSTLFDPRKRSEKRHEKELQEVENAVISLKNLKEQANGK